MSSVTRCTSTVRRLYSAYHISSNKLNLVKFAFIGVCQSPLVRPVTSRPRNQKHSIFSLKKRQKGTLFLFDHNLVWSNYTVGQINLRFFWTCNFNCSRRIGRLVWFVRATLSLDKEFELGASNSGHQSLLKMGSRLLRNRWLIFDKLFGTSGLHKLSGLHPLQTLNGTTTGVPPVDRLGRSGKGPCRTVSKR